MNKVYACIDGLANTASVIDWASWSALRLDVPLECLHVLERAPDRGATGDLSGTIGLDAQSSLLHELGELDHQRGKVALEAGRLLLAGARERAAAAGVQRQDGRLRHGDLMESLFDLEGDARLFVMGEHRRGAPGVRLHLDHRVERVVRSVHRPVLVVTSETFLAPARFVIAFDGSATARKTVEMVARSPLLSGLPALLAMAGDDTPQARHQLDEACGVLTDAGFAADVALSPGEPEDVLPTLVRQHGAGLLVMGAYGHSRIRQLIVGSTTTTLLRVSNVPVLVLR